MTKKEKKKKKKLKVQQPIGFNKIMCLRRSNYRKNLTMWFLDTSAESQDNDKSVIL